MNTNTDMWVAPPWGVWMLEPRAAEFLAARRGRITRSEAGVFAAGSKPALGVPRGKSAPRIAVVEILGMISPNVWSWLGTDPHVARAEVRAARLNPDVDGVALLVDSPGGTAVGVEELAAEIRATRERKPVAALVTGMSGSAAFWVTSAAGHVVAMPSSDLGSVGVFVMHANVSGALQKEGIEVTLLSSKLSPFKTEGNSFEALSADARAYYQREVDRIAGQFVADLARNRGVSRDYVTTAFGQGRMLPARDAVARGMADSLGTPEEALARFPWDGPRKTPRGAQATEASLGRLSTAELQAMGYSPQEAARLKLLAMGEPLPPAPEPRRPITDAERAAAFGRMRLL